MSVYTKEVETFNFDNIVDAMEYMAQEELQIGTSYDGDGEGTYEYKCELFQTDPGYQLVVTTISDIWELC
ncbi:hypothetical protein N9N32_00460 [Alphaproteobacteria bacterium]|nr:hypothetical protein [Alphaproteobacteria bacterium]